jgi:uncharacterized membrane protein
MKLTSEEKSGIEKLVTRIEAGTGVQVLAVVSDKSDTYPETPWKAFSLGVALAILALTLAVPLRFSWTGLPAILSAIIVLSAGLALSLATIFIRPVGRIFLGSGRAGVETRQFALSFFFDRGLTRTRSRIGLLVLASQYERRAAVVGDTRITERIPQTDLDRIPAIMDAILARGSTYDAMIKGLTALDELLKSRGFNTPPTAGDEIPEEFLETEGPKA